MACTGYVTIRPNTLGKEPYSVLTSGNGYQWTVVFDGSHTACIRIAKAFMKEGSKDYKGNVKQWFA